MLNYRPIFINAFARGGSNILMNLLLSHPDVCISSGETHKVFKGTKWDHLPIKIRKRAFYDFPIRLLTGQDLFGIDCLEPRKPVHELLQRYIDRILYYGRFRARIDTHNRFKHENTLYTKVELGQCRLLTKGLNGLVYTVDLFKKMYSDATFFGLIRNGLAICEGYVRRGFTAETIAHTYRLVSEKMMQYSSQMENYHLLKYEAMVENPLQFMAEIYKYTELDIHQVSKVRLQAKGVMGVNGKRKVLKGRDRQLFWYEASELHQHIKKDINENQIQQLRAEDKDKFMQIAGGVMEVLGYTEKAH